MSNQLSEFIEQAVSLDEKVLDRFGYEDPFRAKLDVLERLLEVVRYERRYDQNSLHIGNFLSLDIVPLGGHIHVAKFDASRDMPYSYRNPEDIQVPLLIHLLLNHHKRTPVYWIIDGFIREMRSTLSIYDFEKTTTGVTRCFTNTRFAARKLREFGLLQFTKKEAYKTWRLSFLGVVAAGLYYDSEWRTNVYGLTLDERLTTKKVPLCWDLWMTVGSLGRNLDLLVRTVSSLCEKGGISEQLRKEVAQEIETVYGDVMQYVKAMKSSKLSEKQRINASQEFVERVHGYPSIEGFMNELSLSFEKKEFLAAVEDIFRGHK